MAGVVTGTGPLGAGDWGSALGHVLRGFGGLGIQGFLVLPPFLVPLLVPGGSLLLPGRCTAAALQLSRNFFSITSHMETLIVAPDGYLLGFSSSSIPSGRSPSPGLSSACGGSGRRILLPAASLPLPAGGRRPYPRGNPRSRYTAWRWGCGHVLPASCKFTMGARSPRCTSPGAGG